MTQPYNLDTSVMSKQKQNPHSYGPWGSPVVGRLPVLRHQAFPFRNREGKGETDIQLQVKKLLDDKLTN